jgi:hypothetical protein
MSKLLNGRSYGTEEYRRAVAKAFGYKDLDAFLRFGRSLMDRNQEMTTVGEEFRRGLKLVDASKDDRAEKRQAAPDDDDRQNRLIDHVAGRLREMMEQDPDLYHYFRVRLEAVFIEVENMMDGEEDERS